MLDNLGMEWLWMGVGFIAGIGSSWFVADLVYPIKRK